MKWIQKIKEKASSSSYLKSVLTLMSGTILSQGIIVLSTPLLTRIYTPEEFGGYAVYVSILYSITILASLQYDAAIPLPKRENDAFHLLSLSVLTVLGMSLLVFVVVLMFQDLVAQLFQNFHFEEYLWLLPFSFAGFGIFQVMNSWLIRHEAYPYMAKGKVAMNLGQLFFQFVFAPIGFLGLVVGEVLGRFCGSGTIAAFSWRYIETKWRKFSFQRMMGLAAQYKHFPLITSWSSILNVVSFHLPTLFIASSFGPAVAGWYLLAQRVLSIPESLVGFSVKQVYYSKATKMVRTSNPLIISLFWQTVWKMSWVSFLIIGSLAVIAPYIFRFVFGDGWTEAGFYVQILAVLYFMQMVVGPIATNFYVFERQGLQLAAEGIRCMVILFAVWFCSIHFSDPLKSIALLSVFSSFGYIVLALCSWLSIRRGLQTKNKKGK